MTDSDQSSAGEEQNQTKDPDPKETGNRSRKTTQPSDTEPEEPDRNAEDQESETNEASERAGAELPRPDFTGLRLRMFNVSCFFYLIMAGIGLFWMRSQNIVSLRLSTSTNEVQLGYSLLSGVAIALIVFGLGAVLRRTTDWAKTFEREFAPVVNVFGYMQVPVLAFVSAAGEELFFRGALQEGLGLYTSALLFGLIHIPWKKLMWPWPIFALVLGLAFGFIVRWTGSLYGPFLGHFLINLVNIYLIKKRHPMEPEEIIDHMMNRT